MQGVILRTVWVLLTLALVSSHADRIERIRNGHPTDFLVSSPGVHQREPAAVAREQKEEQERVESMTRQLMERLASRGTDPHRPSVRYILDVFEKLEKGADLQEATGHQGRVDVIGDADIIRGVAPVVSTRRRSKADVVLNFPLSDTLGSDETELAELRIRPMERHPAASRSSGSRAAPRPARRRGLQRVRVSILDKNGDRQMERIYRVQWRLDDKDDFDVLDVTRVLKDMAASGARTYVNGSLEISLRKTRRNRGGSRRHPRSLPDATSGEEMKFTEDDAMMVVYSKSTQATPSDDNSIRTLQRSAVGRSGDAETESSGHRERRSAGGRRRKNKCAPRDMFIDFETLGWADNIIFPIRYNARTCAGRCPSPVDHSLHPTNHAILKSMMRLHDKKVPRPCCVPVTLKPLMMLYKLDDGNIEIRHHPDMVVSECGCR